MAIVNLPASLRLGPGSGMGLARFDLTAMSESTGAEQTRLLGPARWTLALTQPANLTLADGGAWQGVLARLAGRTNHLLAWDPMRVQPLGSMRGSPVLNGQHLTSAVALAIATGQAGCTLKAGDWLQLGSGLGTSQLVMVTADATADGAGAISVSFAHTLRTTFANNTVVTWLRASAYFRMMSDGVSWRYGAGQLVTGMSVDFMEAWS